VAERPEERVKTTKRRRKEGRKAERIRGKKENPGARDDEKYGGAQTLRLGGDSRSVRQEKVTANKM